jgi:voltage-gated potassium channel Kch
MAAHGHPRATGDIALWIRPSADNARRVIQALTTFGAPLTNVSAEDFEAANTVVQIGVSPRRIDILTSIDGVGFEAAWPDRVEISIEGLTVPVLSKHHLIQNKEQLGRTQDLADIERLRESDA